MLENSSWIENGRPHCQTIISSPCCCCCSCCLTAWGEWLLRLRLFPSNLPPHNWWGRQRDTLSYTLLCRHPLSLHTLYYNFCPRPKQAGVVTQVCNYCYPTQLFHFTRHENDITHKSKTYIAKCTLDNYIAIALIAFLSMISCWHWRIYFGNYLYE